MNVSPRPWTLQEIIKPTVSQSGVLNIRAADGSIVLGTCHRLVGSEKANVQLMTAAPDLLAALEFIIRQPNQVLSSLALDKAVAAINRASTGEAGTPTSSSTGGAT